MAGFWKDKLARLRAWGKEKLALIPAVSMALRDGQTPWFAKILAFLTVGYALSPIDLIPDFIPVLGALDDLVLLPVLVALTLQCIPKEILERCKTRAEGLWADGKPKRWYYALPIVLFWALLLFVIVKAIVF